MVRSHPPPKVWISWFGPRNMEETMHVLSSGSRRTEMIQFLRRAWKNVRAISQKLVRLEIQLYIAESTPPHGW